MRGCGESCCGGGGGGSEGEQWVLRLSFEPFKGG